MNKESQLKSLQGKWKDVGEDYVDIIEIKGEQAIDGEGNKSSIIWDATNLSWNIEGSVMEGIKKISIMNEDEIGLTITKGFGIKSPITISLFRDK